MRNGLLVVLALGVLAACTRVTVFGHAVKDEDPATARAPATASARATAVAPAVPVTSAAGLPISRIAVEFTPAARKQTDADERFNPELLRDAIVAELRSRQLLDMHRPDSGRALVIQVEEFQVRATSNVVMFGRLPSAGVLDGVARISATAGETRELRVRAEVAMQVSRKSDDKNPLKALYRGFAEQFVAAFTGTAPRQPERR